MATVTFEEVSPSVEPQIVPNPLAAGLDPDWTLAELQDHLGGIPLDRIRLFPSPGQATEQHLLALLDRKTCLAELIDGVLVEKTVGQLESRLALLIGFLIQKFILPSNLGVVYGADCPIRLLPKQVREPDVSYFSWSRFPDGKLPVAQVLEIAPDLAVEVISLSNTTAEMERKVEEYFRAGTKLVWYVYPRTQTLRVFKSSTEFQDLKDDELLDGADVLPGFEVSIKALFLQAFGQSIPGTV